MKKSLLLLALLFFATVASITAQVVNVSGDITTNTTWTKNNSYLLNGFVYVKNGAILTIEPGTVIKGDKASRASLIITRGARIIADGTFNEPIVFTSNESIPAAGDWGGLIILGRASTNGSFSGTAGLQAIEGDINNANGDGLFGNGDLAGPATQYDNDNSGILRYVRIEYPGVVITPGNEINGLTMGGVGRGTTMDYVQVSFSNDDSFEWFGGNVNAKHLIAYRGLDDDFDTDNGFSGTIQFAFTQRDPAVSDAAGASNSFESDNDANATTATPKTAANFVNVTVVGPSTVDAAQFFSRGALLRRNTEQALFNCLIVGAWPNAGLRIDGTNTGANATAGTLEVKNLVIAGATTPVNTNAAGFDVNAWFATAGWGNQSFPASGDAKLNDPFNLNAPNLVPQAGSPVLNAGSFSSSPRIQNNPYVIKVGYVGAFGDNDWTCGWARFAGGSTPCGATVVSGNITTNTTWTKDKTYVLNGFVYVKNCATLTIEPGTIIKGDKATRGTLIVTRCAKIVADGTFNEPIVFTSSSATPAAGDWGGLVILGRATTNGSFNGTVGLQAIEGDLNNAAGDGLFGNGDLAGPATQYDNDNSGILRYVRIEYPGIVITPGNEINGLTLGGVGRGTTMDYVQVSYSNDDSYEWFGGNVNAKHLIAYRGLDDDFDTDNGFSGNIQFAFSVRDPQVSDAAGASNSFESDNDANATEAAPKTSATFSNVTVVGPSTVDATQFFSRGALLRRNTNQALFNTLIIGSWPNAGLRIDGTTTGANATAGTLEVKNTIIAGPATAVNTNAAGFDVNAWFGTAGWGNQSFPASADAKLTDPFNLNTPNLLPLAGSPVLNASNFAATRVNNANFIKVPYVGAFGDNDWTCGWARFEGGATLCAPTVISGNITTNTTWTKNNTYVLNGFVYVKNCATLTIEPGTVIKGDKATRGTLIVTRCAKIVADGTFNEPIVFTSGAASPAAGDWGGLVILGRATTNGSFNGTVGLQAIEGDLNNAAGDGLFGNGDLAGPATQYDNDNSGILRYVRIEYPGIVITPGNEINGLTLGGVGRGTTMDYVQVSYSNDDSYEWFGGNVNAKHLIAYRGLDDDFDTDNGFSGNIQFAFSVRDPQVSDAAGASNSFESDNDANATEAAPKTAATFSNVTVVGPSTADAAQFFSRGALLRRNTNQSLFNTLIVGAWPNAGLRIDGTNTGANATAGTLEAKNIIIAGPATAVNTNAAGFDVNAWFGTAGWGNQSFPASADAKLTDPFNLNTPNLLPLAGSPVLNASSFAATRVNNANFIKVPYVGAFGDIDWTCGWARFAGGATPCAPTVISGNITTNTTWTKDNTYVLNGFVYVKNCATLTIEPGTVIKGDKATRGTLIVTRCAKIVADGTRNQPIVFTSASATPAAGDWGGLVILGRATTNGSFNGTVGLQAIEGDLNNAAGDGLFGNGDLPTPTPPTLYENDNSGILRYVRIEYPGIVITPGNEINGLTLGGVGRGTTLDYVQVSFSNDDSYEWFGGNVNAKHLIAYRGLDDDFDTDNGFSGNIQFAFSLRDPAVSDAAGASNSFESDNDANATDAAPKTAATFSNVTVVGPSTVDATQFFSRGALLRRNTNQSLFNTLIVGAWPNAGLRIDGTNTGANATAGTLEVKNVIIAGAATPVNTNAAGFNVNTWFGTAGWGNQSFPASADAKLTDPFNLNTPNLVPQAGSPVWTAASFDAARVNNPSFIKVPYVGAFGDIDWTCGWARFSGGVGPCAPEVISGDITTNTTWTNAKEYTLNGFVYVKNCATLTIEPGTVIKGDKATRGTLIVSRCSKIVADGTADAPIVFTSSSATPTAGDWGGLIILGRASTNGSFNGVTGLQAVEGDINNANGDGLFGNGDLAGPASQYDNDNSGVLRYVRIEYPGIVITPGNEINGLTMGGVGRGTTMDYVQVSYSNDDSYEWFGGNVNAKHLIAYRGLDDDFDTDNGFSGNLQFLLGVRDPQVSDAAGASNGFESDNDANATTATPKTAATITNATMIAPATVDATQFFSRGALLRRNTEQSLFNTIFVGAWPNAGIRIDGNNTGANATANLLEVKNVSIAGAPTVVNTNAAGFDVTAWYNTNGWGNQSYLSSNGVQLTNPFNVDLPNAVPNLLSPVLTNGSFVSSTRLNNSFFTTVNYSGAFGRVNGSINDWTCKWASFKGGAADCVTSTDDFDQVVNTLKLFPTVTGDYTNLEIDLKENVNLNVTIYGMNGTNFGTLLDENVSAGNQVIGLNVSNLTAGFYFVQIQAGNAVKTEKLIIVR